MLDVKAALDSVLAQPGVEYVGAWGGSMGGATMIRSTAQFPKIEALFVDSSFASLDVEFNLLVPYPVINPLAKLIARIETGININQREESAPHLAIYLDNPRRYKKRLVGFFDEWLIGK